MFNGRDHCEYGRSQWEMLLQCNGISHWLCSYPQWSLNGPARSMSSLLLWNCIGHISEQVEFFTLCPRLWRFSWPGMGVTKLIFSVPLCLLVFFFFCLILLKLVLGWTIGLWDGGRRFHFICQHWFRIYAAMVSMSYCWSFIWGILMMEVMYIFSHLPHRCTLAKVPLILLMHLCMLWKACKHAATVAPFEISLKAWHSVSCCHSLSDFDFEVCTFKYLQGWF